VSSDHSEALTLFWTLLSVLTHYNALFVGQLQLIQNAASRILLKCGNITPVLESLHKLRTQYRHKALNSLALRCICDFLTVYNSIRSLRKSDADILGVPRIKYKSAEGAFGYCGPDLWNKPPAEFS